MLSTGCIVIDETEVERVLHYLLDSAEESARKRSERLYLEDFSRSIKAQIQSEHLAEPLGAQERYAYSDIRYRNHLAALKHAIFEDERARFLRDAAMVKLDLYRTQCANDRGKL